MRVQDVMTENVQTIAPTAATEDAWNTMRCVVSQNGTALSASSAGTLKR